MRLIDADEQREKLIQRYFAAYDWKDKTVYKEKADGAIGAYIEAIRTLNNAPTIDAVPVDDHFRESTKMVEENERDWKMTNADKIRHMTDKELAELIVNAEQTKVDYCCVEMCKRCNGYYKGCVECCLYWLNKNSEEEEKTDG